eukprot:509719_1
MYANNTNSKSNNTNNNDHSLNCLNDLFKVSDPINITKSEHDKPQSPPHGQPFDHIGLRSLLNLYPSASYAPQVPIQTQVPFNTINNNYTLLLTPNGLLSLATPSLVHSINAINQINTINTINTFNNTMISNPAPLHSLFPSLPMNALNATQSTLPSLPSIPVVHSLPLSIPPNIADSTNELVIKPRHVSFTNSAPSEIISARNNSTPKIESDTTGHAEIHEHHISDTRSPHYRCNGCNKKYNHQRDLLHHLTHNKADEKKPYACTQCCKSFTRLGNLNNHNRTHNHNGRRSNDIPPAVKTERMSNGDKNKHIIMSEHIRMKIERANSASAKPFKCDECSKSFRNKSGLSNHRITHNGDKPHKCTVSGCGKSVARSCDLTRHTRLHTGHKPFKCQYKTCHKSFTRSVQLRLHLMDHTGQRPFKCDICMKGFKTLQNAQIHMRIHTGEKPYVCTYCKKRFTQSSSLKTHLASIHSEE